MTCKTEFEPRLVGYDQRFDLPSVVSGMLGVPDLQALDGSGAALVTRETDQSSRFKSAFYDRFESVLGPVYREFVAHVVPSVFGDRRVYYQRVPTFRVQLPDNLAVGSIHKDADFNHQDGAINFWVPLCEAFDSNTIWLECARGSGTFQPWNVAPPQVLVFDGVNWCHGNMRNRTGKSRVSFDFRVIAADVYQDTGLRSVHAGCVLGLGDYYVEL